MRRPLTILVISLVLYAGIITPFSDYMRQKPVEEKLGYVPSLKVIRILSADQKELVSASLILKVLMYYGGLVMKAQSNILSSPPDYVMMSRIIHGSLQLDPYNMDGYYFAQSFLVWEAHQVAVANNLLQYGMKYRTWDWYLPFFAGFNYAYFLKDYSNAAKYYRLAAELSGTPLYVSLSARYLQRAGHTDLAIAYLESMSKSAKGVVKDAYQLRLNAFKEVRKIERARDTFVKSRGKLPDSVTELINAGYLAESPRDPYGGTFFIKPDGSVATTSNFTFAAVKK